MSALAKSEPRLVEATPLMRLDGLSKRYGPVVALDDVSAHVYPGEVLGIVGESGSGKSTLLRMMNLQETPDAGRYALDLPDLYPFVLGEGVREKLTLAHGSLRRAGQV